MIPQSRILHNNKNYFCKPKKQTNKYFWDGLDINSTNKHKIYDILCVYEKQKICLNFTCYIINLEPKNNLNLKKGKTPPYSK